MAGFGGVAEYGITVRWDKNFLKLIRLLLERRAEFSMFGGVRFGGTLGIEQAFELGFDHIALCAGAGRPTVIPMKNGLARGVRQASDFLMALQLTGAAKTDSVANLSIRLPIVVIGGGLTAIDTATESLAYYPVQVEKFLTRYETLVAERGEAAVRADWSEEERATADEFIAHAARHPRRARGGGARDTASRISSALLTQWGGVTIAYRRRLDRRAELHAQSRGSGEGDGRGHPLRRRPDAGGGRGRPASATPPRSRCTSARGDGTVTLPARAILVAAGTQPNTVLGREDPSHVALDGRFFQAYDEEGNPATPERVAKPAAVRVLMSLQPDGRAVSFFGDLHPSLFGQCREGDGRGAARLSGRQPRHGEGSRRARRRPPNSRRACATR